MTPNTDNPDKPQYCERCGRDHAVDALIQEHLDELFDDGKPPANHGDKLDDLRFDLRLTERQLEELEAGKTYCLPLTDNLRAAVLFLHHRQLAERLQKVYDEAADAGFWLKNEAVIKLDELETIIKELMPKEAE